MPVVWHKVVVLTAMPIDQETPDTASCATQDALEAVVDDDRSLPLFEEAEKKFQETTAHGAHRLTWTNDIRNALP